MTRRVSSWGELLEAAPESGSRSGTERRAWVRHICDFETTFKPVKSTTAPQPARIRNVCRRGLGLQLGMAYDCGTILSVDLPAGDATPLCTFLACVVHVEEIAPGTWGLGCSFVTELSDDELHQFGAERVPGADSDQRVWQRFPCSAEVNYRAVRVTERDHSRGQAVDLSAMGIGMTVDRLLEVGTVLSLQLADDHGQTVLKTLACVVRATPRDAGDWLVGCNFIRELGALELEQVRHAAALAVSA